MKNLKHARFRRRVVDAAICAVFSFALASLAHVWPHLRVWFEWTLTVGVGTAALLVFIAHPAHDTWRIRLSLGAVVFAAMFGLWCPLAVFVVARAAIALVCGVAGWQLPPLPSRADIAAEIMRRLERARAGTLAVIGVLLISLLVFAMVSAVQAMTGKPKPPHPHPLVPSSLVSSTSTAPGPVRTTTSSPPTSVVSTTTPTTVPNGCDPDVVSGQLVQDLGPVVGAGAATYYTSRQLTDPGCPSQEAQYFETYGRMTDVPLFGQVRGYVDLVVNDVGDPSLVASEFHAIVIGDVKGGTVARVSDVWNIHGMHVYEVEHVDGTCDLAWEPGGSTPPIHVRTADLAPAVGYLASQFKQMPAIVNPLATTDSSITIGFSGKNGVPVVIPITVRNHTVHVATGEAAAATAHTCLLPSTWSTFGPAPAIKSN